MPLVFQSEVQGPMSEELEISLAFHRAEDEKFWGPYQSFPKNPDDWYIWPDGTMAQWEEIAAGEYSYMSDDYRLATDKEVVNYHDGNQTEYTQYLEEVASWVERNPEAQ